VDGHELWYIPLMQVHKRLTTEQVSVILKEYTSGHLLLHNALDLLGIKRSRFFLLVKKYKEERSTFTIAYHRRSRKRLTRKTEKAIKTVLLEDKALISDPSVPITSYNYAATKDRLEDMGIHVATSTIIERAKAYDCYKPTWRKERVHDREVLTSAIGALIQHDSSHHQWSPYAKEKWYLITSLDDYSRMLLFADLLERETSWEHIRAAKQLMLTYGIPLQYYTDQLRTFRYISHQDSIHILQPLPTDGVNPQWKQVVQSMGSKVIYALSPQAKGKIERPYRWLQDRIVRTCAREKVERIQDAREVLAYEVNRYNSKQIHSTTKEIPRMRFTKAKQEGKTLFRPFTLPPPYRNLNDVFCLRITRRTNAYRKVSIYGLEISTKADPYQEVDIHLIPDTENGAIEARIWWHNKLISKVHYPQNLFPKVQF